MWKMSENKCGYVCICVCMNMCQHMSSVCGYVSIHKYSTNLGLDEPRKGTISIYKQGPEGNDVRNTSPGCGEPRKGTMSEIQIRVVENVYQSSLAQG